MDDLQAADAIFVVAHSQGSVVSTHLLNRLIHGRHIRTAKNVPATDLGSSFSGEVGVQVASTSNPQKICCLAMCGIHLGPLRYLRNSSLVQPYLHVCFNLFPMYWYWEGPFLVLRIECYPRIVWVPGMWHCRVARNIFQWLVFLAEHRECSIQVLYRCPSSCLGQRCMFISENWIEVKTQLPLDRFQVKMVYVASMDDQVVPVYSGLFTAISHPLILRALYIDGDAYQ